MSHLTLSLLADIIFLMLVIIFPDFGITHIDLVSNISQIKLNIINSNFFRCTEFLLVLLIIGCNFIITDLDLINILLLRDTQITNFSLLILQTMITLSFTFGYKGSPHNAIAQVFILNITRQLHFKQFCRDTLNGENLMIVFWGKLAICILKGRHSM